MSLSKQQVELFRNEGYLIVENVLNREDLEPVIAAIEQFINERAKQL